MTMKITIPFQGQLTRSKIVELLAPVQQLDLFDEVIIEIPRKPFLRTCAIAQFTAWLIHTKWRGIEVKVQGNCDSLSYLTRMDVFKYAGMNVDEPFQRHPSAGRFVPAIPIEGINSTQNAVNAICEACIRQCEQANSFVPAFQWALFEITDNIELHSDSNTPGIVIAQFMPKKNTLDVAICDMGRGLKASLSESVTTQNHQEAIVKAITRGVTRNRSIGQGNGLAGTIEILKVNGGRLEIWTGDKTLIMDNLGNFSFKDTAYFPGTGLFLSLQTNNPIDLRKTFIQDNSYTYFESEIEKIASAGGIRIADECHYTGNRSAATGLMRKICTLYPKFAEPIYLDFDGVLFASSSFLDELLGRLAENYGIQQFRQYVKIKNMRQDLFDMANIVIHQRLEGSSC